MENKEVLETKPTQEEVVKDYYTKAEVEDLINKKIGNSLGDIIKQINNQPKPKQDESPKEKTLEDFLF